ncbi:MAG TPA: ribosome maturation factor RimM [Dehalococcoidia bacterium]|nr:ribosome maturation factor RimM [Dehalococcoidia bacterium]
MPGGRTPKPRGTPPASGRVSARESAAPKTSPGQRSEPISRPPRTRTTAGAGRASQEPQRRRPARDPRPGFVAVGRVLAPFGLKGELKVLALTDNPERFAPKSRLYADEQPVTVLAAREAGGHLYVRLKGFNDRTSVEKLRHAMLQVPESELPALPAGEYYRFQLVGLEVVCRDGTPVGTLEEVIETGANDVYRVRTPEGQDILLPALDDVIVSVDLDAKRMVADPPEWR